MYFLTRLPFNIKKEYLIKILIIFPEPSTCWKTGARYCIVTFCCLNVVMLLFGGLWPALSQYSKDDHKRIVIIQTDRLVNIVNERFLSVALDSAIIQRNFRKFDMR